MLSIASPRLADSSLLLRPLAFQVQLLKRNTDDALNRAAEALRLLRLLGDRGREVQVLCTATEAAMAMGATRQALAFSLDALTTARKLQDRLLEAGFRSKERRFK